MSNFYVKQVKCVKFPWRRSSWAQQSKNRVHHSASVDTNRRLRSRVTLHVNMWEIIPTFRSHSTNISGWIWELKIRVMIRMPSKHKTLELKEQKQINKISLFMSLKSLKKLVCSHRNGLITLLPIRNYSLIIEVVINICCFFNILNKM